MDPQVSLESFSGHTGKAQIPFFTVHSGSLFYIEMVFQVRNHLLDGFYLNTVIVHPTSMEVNGSIFVFKLTSFPAF